MLPARCGALGGSRRLPHHSLAFNSHARFLVPCSATQCTTAADDTVARQAVARSTQARMHLAGCNCSSTCTTRLPAGGSDRSMSFGTVVSVASLASRAAVNRIFVRDAGVAAGAAERGKDSGAITDASRGASSCSCSSVSESSGRSRNWASTSTSRNGGLDTVVMGNGVSNGRRGADAMPAGAGPIFGPGLLVEDTTPENWLAPLRRPGSVVALGKFDALHRGHCALAAAAAALVREINAGQTGGTAVSAGPEGDAVLLSFSGMAAVLGWPERLPLTAPQDRGRVLASWAGAFSGPARRRESAKDNGQADSCSKAAIAAAADTAAGSRHRRAAATAVAAPPRLRTLPFALIRSMSPEQFVALLARDLGAAGVVAGRNYRFGYRAAGDVDTLVRLGQQHGMRVTVVDLVTLPDHCTESAASENSAASLATVNATDGRKANGLGMPAAVGATAGYESSNCNTTSNSSSSCVATTSCSGTASRVSSSRIRALLEGGQVGSVEQLLGRKYRLVCDVRAVGATSCTAAPAASFKGKSSYGGSSSTSAGSESSEIVGSQESGSGSGCGKFGRLLVPCAAYQNQPPAHGQYRALVQFVSGPQIPVSGAGATDGGNLSNDGEGYAGAGVCKAEPVARGQQSGPMCTMVTLSDAGLEVALDEMRLRGWVHMDGLLLVDFDACG